MVNRCSKQCTRLPKLIAFRNQAKERHHSLWVAMRILLIYNYKYIILLLISSRKVQIWTYKPWLFCLVFPLWEMFDWDYKWLAQWTSELNFEVNMYEVPIIFQGSSGTDLLDTKFCWLIMLRLVCVLKTFSAIYSLLKQCIELENLNRSSTPEVIMCVEKNFIIRKI
jgi:hypothetical protein